MDLVGLLLSLWLAVSRSEQAVLLFEDGRIEPTSGSSALAATSLEGLTGAWVWSATSAPRRLSAEGYRRRRASNIREGEGPLQIVVATAPGTNLQGVRLIAGPAAMWREVPEPWLPSWPVPSSGRLQIPVDSSRALRLRLAGERAGSWWIDLPAGRRRTRLTATPAATVEVTVEGPDGEDLDGADLHVLAGAPGTDRGDRELAIYRSAAKQGLTIEGLPNLSELTWVASHDDHPPRLLRCLPSQLPLRLRLAAGSRVTGRLVDDRGSGLGGVQVRLRAWVDPAAPLPFARAVTSERDGRFSLRGVRSGQAVFFAEKEGLAPLRRVVDVDRPLVDLGSLTVTRGSAARVLVIDREAAPVVGAEVAADPGNPASTGQDGIATLTHLAPGAIEIRVAAKGYLPAKRALSIPAASDPVTVEVERGLVVTGRFLDARRRPLLDAFVVIQRGSYSWTEMLEPSGELGLVLAPGEEHILSFASSTSGSLRLTLGQGQPGERRDLGELLAPEAAAIAGRLVDAETGEPVAGGRIWAPRPSERGPVLAWMHSDLLATTSGRDGTFRLVGIALGPNMLRIDAPGYARLARTVPISDATTTVELGDVSLSRGARVHVTAAGGDDQGVTAQIDPTAQGLEFDLLTAPVVGGHAVIERVPAGSATLAVVRGRAILCEKEIRVPEGAREVEAECTAEAMVVRGTVTASATRPGPGLLIWMPEPSRYPEGINNFVLPGGLVQQRIFTTSKPQVNVRVDAEGRFESHDLRAGRWDVSWYPESGGPTEAQPVLLAAMPEQRVSLTFAGLSVHGAVRDAEGEPVVGAQVRETQGGATTFTGEDGTFRFSSLREASTYYFVAFAGELESDPVELAVGADRRPEPLTLIVKDPSHRPALVVRAVDAEGAGASGAFVFLEGVGIGLQVLSTDRGGEARFLLQPPYPETVRAAVFSQGQWSLGEWKRLGGLEQGLTVALRQTGALRVSSEAQTVNLRVLGPGGWDVILLSRLLGFQPSVQTDQALELRGLPPGEYQVELDKSSGRQTVRAGEVSELRFE